MRSIVFCVGFGLVVAACDTTVVAGTSAHVPENAVTGLQAPASGHNVSITASLGGRGPLGDTVAIHIHNDGAETAFIPRCGTGPLILVQQFMNGAWFGGVQNFMCVAPSASGPVQLLGGASIDLVRVFQAGRYRITASVATTTDLSNSMTAVSNQFDAP
jgi:hypothetical protein